MTVAAQARDLDAVREGLQRWLAARHPEWEDVRVGPLGKPTSGYSSETLLVDVLRTAGGADVQELLVARLPPAGGGIFPDYDLDRQAEVQRALLASGLPAATPVAVEHDEGWVGAPFFVMERVEGDILPEGYVAAGLLHDADPDAQRTVHSGFLDALATVHSLDWDGLGLGVLTPADARGLAHDVDRAETYLAWAGDGDSPPVLVDALAWLRDHRPDPEPPLSLCWGDPRLGNVIYGPGFTPRAFLDWEMASISPAELDLAWFVGLHDVSAEAVGADLPGCLAHHDARARGAARLGRAVVDYRWFEVMSLLRADSIFLRIRRMLLAAGLDEPWLHGVTPGQTHIASIIQ